MRKIYFTLLLFIPIISLAQSNYKSAYVVDLKGDTLRGYIDFKEWGRNPKSISFRSALNGNSKELGVTEISYFEIAGYVSYQSYTVSISLNTVDVQSVPAAIDSTFTTGNVFLKVLEKGRYVTLYMYKDGLKERFYIKEKGQRTPTELLYGIYQDPNNQTNIITKNSYQATLNQLVTKYQPGNDKLIGRVQESGYKDYSLIPIVAQINGSANEETAAKTGKHNPPVRFFAGASVISSALNFSNITAESYYYGFTSSTSTAPKISAGVDLLPNPDVGRLVFRLELGYAQNKFSFAEQPNNIFNEPNPILFSESYKMNAIFITPQIIYNIYNLAALKIFIDAGYSFNLISFPNATIVTKQSGVTLYTTTTQGLDANKGNYTTFMFKAGAVISKRFELYAAYYLGAAVTDSFAYNTNLTSFQVGVNYFIGKVAQ
jgi:hypothetical protein